ncbi:uncharacterized protein LOC142239921 [Haematobia irritans]|uniref:uncharacterized protein LOC142239921 n=1 Tax=Haematobia irritans TaxID=7368 RepID=UPI003F4FDE3B
MTSNYKPCSYLWMSRLVDDYEPSKSYTEVQQDKAKYCQKLPFNNKNDLNEFENLLQENEEKLKQIKEVTAKTGGEGHAQFLRYSVRKVYSDELATLYGWKGTSTKPSAEKSFIITLIKNICHLKYETTDREMNVVLQKHFVHAKDRLTKTKRSD